MDMVLPMHRKHEQKRFLCSKCDHKSEGDVNIRVHSKNKQEDHDDSNENFNIEAESNFAVDQVSPVLNNASKSDEQVPGHEELKNTNGDITNKNYYEAGPDKLTNESTVVSQLNVCNVYNAVLTVDVTSFVYFVIIVDTKNFAENA